MKEHTLKLLFCTALSVLALGASAQINPTTQIKGVSPAAADYLLMTRPADGKLEYQSLSYLVSLLPDEVVTGSVDPTAPPSGAQGNLYINSLSGQVFVWNGDAWTALDGEDEVLQGPGTPTLPPGAGQGLLYVDSNTGILYAYNGSTWLSYALPAFENALSLTAGTVRWGGNLVQNTAINGKSAYSLSMDSLSSLTLRARTNSGSASGVLGISSFESIGLYGTLSRSANPIEASQFSFKPDATYIRTRDNNIRGEISTTDFSARMAYITGENDLQEAFYVDSTGHYLKNIQDKEASQTQLLYIDPLTFEIAKGSAPAIPPSLSSYEVPISGSGGLSMRVTALGAGVSASASAGQLTITIPADVQLLTAALTGSDSDNDPSGNLSVTFAGPGLVGNESIATLRAPATQKLDLSAQIFGPPSPGNPYSVDDDDTVQMQIIGVGTPAAPSLTIRAVGLTANYDNYQLLFNF